MHAPTAMHEHAHRYAIDEHAASDERTYAVFTHLVGLISALDMGFGLLSTIATVIMWQIRKNESPFLDDHLREAVNFQISLLLYAVVATIVTFGFGLIVFLPLLTVLRLVGCIRGAVFANKGRFYRYPMSLRFIG